MNKILVVIKNNSIIFSTYTKEIDKDDLNNTNVINTKKLKFTEEYIIENLELISSFFNLVVIKSEVDTAIIRNLEIAESILKLLNFIPKVTSVVFEEDRELNYTISSLLLDNKNLNKIDCFSLPEIMFYKFHDNIIETRCEILSASDFINSNNIDTYSKLCNKDKIIIDSYLIRNGDGDDFVYFFKQNKSLKKIIIKGYLQSNLLTFLDLIKENNFKNVTIIICEDSNTTQSIIKDISLFDKLNKKYNVNIKVKYSKEYREKNGIKELNISLLRNILLLLVLLSAAIMLLIKIRENNNSKNIDVNLLMIESAIDEVIEDYDNIDSDDLENINIDNYVSPYYAKYDAIYNKLLELNNDTVGWLSVKNTKIDYPVVQAKDNDFYLNHAFDKSVNGAGWVFTDYRNNMNSLNKNTIIYAHSVRKNSLMFGSLKNVLQESWYSNKDNLTISFDIKGKSYDWKIFSIYIIPTTNDYLEVNFSGSISYRNFLNKIKNRSIVDFHENVTTDDKILTLSTCYDDYNRLVVHAKLIK